MTVTASRSSTAATLRWLPTILLGLVMLLGVRISRWSQGAGTAEEARAPERQTGAQAPGRTTESRPHELDRLAKPNADSRSEQREAAGQQDPGPTGTPRPVKFDEGRPLRGPLLPNVPLPRGVRLEGHVGDQTGAPIQGARIASPRPLSSGGLRHEHGRGARHESGGRDPLGRSRMGACKRDRGGRGPIPQPNPRAHDPRPSDRRGSILGTASNGVRLCGPLEEEPAAPVPGEERDLHARPVNGQLPPGRYEAVATSGTRSNGPVTVDFPKIRTSNSVAFEVSTEDVELRLEFGATLGIEGLARLSSGTPLAEVEVHLSRRENHRYVPREAKRTDGRARILGPDGYPTYVRPITGFPEWSRTLGPLRPGTYLTILDQELDGGSVRLQRERIVIRAGEVTDVRLNEPLEGASILTGEITAGGTPAAGVMVWLSDEIGLAGIGRTDDEGRYAADCNASGIATLNVGPLQFSPLAKRKVALGLGPTSPPTADLAAGVIEGKMLESETSLCFGQAAVSLAGADTAEPPPFRTLGGSSNGHFEVQHLPDGLYELDVSERTGKRSSAWEPQTIEIKNGQRVRDVNLVKRR